MSMMTAAARWFAGKRDLTAELLRLRAQLDQLDANRPSSIDPTKHRQWETDCERLKTEIKAHEGALAIATAEVAKAEAAQCEADADAAHHALVRQARADEKLVAEINVLAAKFAEKLAALEASRKLIRLANETRGSRPFIADPETRVRQRMDRGRPAITEKRKVWVDAAGEITRESITDREGRWVRNPEAVRQEERSFEICAELPPSPMPFERFADATRLIDIDGRQIWPPHK